MVHLADFEVADWNSIPGADAAQVDHWKKNLEAGKKALARKAELEGILERFGKQKSTAQSRLERLEADLPNVILFWAEGRKGPKILADHRQKIADTKQLLQDISEALVVIAKAINHETRTPIRHGNNSMGEIEDLLRKQQKEMAEKK